MARTKEIVYKIKIDDKAVKKLDKDLDKLDTTVNVGMKVDAKALKKLDKELEKDDINIKVKVDDTDIKNIKSDLKGINDRKIDIGLSDELEKAAASSNSLSESSTGMIDKLGVMAQFAETYSQWSLKSVLASRDSVSVLEEVTKINNKIEVSEQHRKALAANMVNLSEEEVAETKSLINIMKKEEKVLKKKVDTLGDVAILNGQNLKLSNAQAKSALWLRNNWKMVGGAIAGAATYLLSLNGYVKDVATSAGVMAKQFANGNWSLVESFKNSQKLLKSQRELVVMQARYEGRAVAGQDAVAKQLAIGDDATRSYKDRYDAYELARISLEALVDQQIKLNNETDKNNRIAEKVAATDEERAQASAKYLQEANAGAEKLNGLREQGRSLTKEINMLDQDVQEQALDFYIDYVATVTNESLKLANNEKADWDKREAALNKAIELNGEAFALQVETLGITQEQLEVVQSLTGEAQWEYILSLGKSEIINNRLLEVLKEQYTVAIAIAEAQAGFAVTRNTSSVGSPGKGSGVAGSGVETPELIESRDLKTTDIGEFYQMMFEYYESDLDNYEGVEKKKQAIRRMFTEDALNSSADLFGALAEMQEQGSKDQFESAKILRYGEAGMSMYAGISNALATGLPYVRWVDAAAIAASGVAQMINIHNTQYGDTSMGSGSGSIVTPNVNNTAPVTSGRALYEYEQHAQPNKSYVVFSDLQAANLDDGNRSVTVDL